MSVPLKSGGVPVALYEAHIGGETFAGFETAARGFLTQNAGPLEPYMRRWVADPLHQWSRVWEYPFVESWIRARVETDADSVRDVLDAGSGITFFPYLLAERFPRLQVTCVDRDLSLASVYERIAHPAANRVRFAPASLAQMPLPDAAFDVIYCISVLEHTENYEAIVAEFRRLLRPGGQLLLTLDISLDGRADIRPARLRELLRELGRRFTTRDPAAIAELNDVEVASAGWVTTESVRCTHPTWLPWRYPRLSGALSSLRQGRWPRFRTKRLTFGCLAFEG